MNILKRELIRVLVFSVLLASCSKDVDNPEPCIITHYDLRGSMNLIDRRSLEHETTFDYCIDHPKGKSFSRVGKPLSNVRDESFKVGYNRGFDEAVTLLHANGFVGPSQFLSMLHGKIKSGEFR